MNISAFDYVLPDDRIARFPEEPRDHSRLLVYRSGEISDAFFYNLADFLPGNCALVFNQTRVIHARLLLKRETGARIEIFLLQPVMPLPEPASVLSSSGETVWKCLVGNKKKWKDGEVLSLAGKTITWHHREENEIRFSAGENAFGEWLQEAGKIPLPPYIQRDTVTSDDIHYQTVYARHEGSVAAPTAGLHFTQHVFEKMAAQHVATDFITLHVGAGTFVPVSVENALEHVMHTERMYFTRSNIEFLLSRENIIPVGTTSLRSLESLYWYGVMLSRDPGAEFHVPQFEPYENPSTLTVKEALTHILLKMEREGTDVLSGETSIFIVPGYRFRITKGLITNFHQPKSTLLLLVSALVGDAWKDIYDHALHNNYRFLSFGDSSLLLP